MLVLLVCLILKSKEWSLFIWLVYNRVYVLRLIALVSISFLADTCASEAFSVGEVVAIGHASDILFMTGFQDVDTLQAWVSSLMVLQRTLFSKNKASVFDLSHSFPHFLHTNMFLSSIFNFDFCFVFGVQTCRALTIFGGLKTSTFLFSKCGYCLLLMLSTSFAGLVGCWPTYLRNPLLFWRVTVLLRWLFLSNLVFGLSFGHL